MKNINIAIVGCGNCAASLVMGLSYYGPGYYNIGLMHEEIGEYKISDIKVVATFDIDKRKIGLPLNEAIFESPNCTKNIIDPTKLRFQEFIINKHPIVLKGPVLDGIAEHMKDYFQVDSSQ